MCARGWVCTSGWQPMSTIALSPFFFFFKQGLSLKLKLPDLATLADQLGPGSLAFLPAQAIILVS